MKKTLSFLMGVLLAAMLPAGNAMAQSKTVVVDIHTLDRAPIVSATIYGDTVIGRTYFVDTAHFDVTLAGTAVSVDSMPYSAPLTASNVTIDDVITSGQALATVDSTTFCNAVIVIRDANDKVYVIGNITGRQQGVFQASNLMTGSTEFTASAISNMLVTTPMINNAGYSYSAFKYASLYCGAGDTLSINFTSPAGMLDTVYSPAVLNFAADTLNGALHIAHTSGTVTIMGGKLNMITGSTDEAPIVMKAIDSLGSFNPGQHATAIESGNYMLINPASGANIVISGGNFGASYPTYTANRFYFGANTAANAAVYPYTIMPGYAVVWHNWDFAGSDTTIYYNESDNKIRPVLASPFPATCDTVINGRFTDAAFTNSWDFLSDTLSQDTNIYVRWTFPGPGMVRARFAHTLMDAYNNVYLTDTVTFYDSVGHSVTEYARNYFDYNCDRASATIDSLASNDTVITFNYYRTTYQLTWNLNGGAFTDGFAETQSLRWGATIDYSHTPVLEGHNFTGWLPTSHSVMPHYDLTLNAQYDQRLYGLTWTGVGGTTPYIGGAIQGISATYVDDNNDTIDAILTFIDANGVTSSTISAVGSYRVVASSPNPNYHFNADTVRTIIVVPATLTVTGTTAEMVKLYDGNRTATVTNPGTLNTVYGNDDVQLAVEALFTDQYPGEGKTVVAHYTISGANATSYVLDTAYSIVGDSNSAVILAPITPNPYYGNGGGYNNSYDPAYVGYNGYCTDTAYITYKMAKVNGVAPVVDQYTLFFDAKAQAEGFVDVTTYTNTYDDTTVMFVIPAAAKAGDYTAKLVLLNSAYPQFVGDTINIKFTVGLNKDYVAAIFGDVLTIVNKGELEGYDQYSWYCNGIEQGYYGQYYQDPNGLSSSNYYFVQLTNSTTGDVIRTCPQSVVDVLAEDQVFQPVVSTYPNPTTDKVSISVENSTNTNHTLRVMNVMGQVIFTTTFEGDNYSLNLDGYALGSYTISVDGTTVRVIKK